MTSPKFSVVAQPDRALVFEGHGQTRAQAIVDARAYLVGQGKRAFDVDEALVDRQGLVVQAHWDRTGVAGFVQPTHLNAVPVTVVNLPGDMSAQHAKGGT